MPSEALRIAHPEAGELATAAELPPPALLMTRHDLAVEFRTSLKTIDRMDAAGRPSRKAWESFYEPARGKQR